MEDISMWAQFFPAAIAATVLTAVITHAAPAADEVHEGKVLSVGDGKITVFDKRDSDNDTFLVNDQTKITRNGKPAKLSDIQVGDMAKVTATSQGEKLIAKEIVAAAPE
jgi:hypothetical protein